LFSLLTIITCLALPLLSNTHSFLLRFYLTFFLPGEHENLRDGSRRGCLPRVRALAFAIKHSLFFLVPFFYLTLPHLILPGEY
jgi:hypothetical protein